MNDLDLRAEFQKLVDDGSVHKLPGWAATIRIDLDDAGTNWAAVAVDEHGLRILPPGTRAEVTVRVSSEEALRRWLVEGVDFTHLVRDGSFAISGNYFDVLLLSKALRLRPEAAGSIRPPDIKEHRG